MGCGKSKIKEEDIEKRATLIQNILIRQQVDHLEERVNELEDITNKIKTSIYFNKIKF